MNTKYDFGQKYQMGGIGKLLIDNFYQNLSELISNLNIDNALEVGAGEGYSSLRIKNILPKNVIFEISEFEEELIEKIKANNIDAKVTQESIYELKKNNSEFDMIFCLEVLEHLEKPEKALSELARVTSKYAVISVPNEPWWRMLNMMRGKYWQDFGNTPGHIQHWNLNSIKQMAGKNFDLVKNASPLPWNILLLKKII
jgi:2-polyprenyl-3-methyl-5-hydroxy-6-metoxy-1,4-benzoquinol methylase